MLEKQPKGWNPSPAKQTKINKSLQNKRTKSWIDRVLQKHKNSNNKSPNTSRGASANTITPTLSTQTADAMQPVILDRSTFTVHTSLESLSFTFKDSWILNNGSDSHVYNSTILF